MSIHVYDDTPIGVGTLSILAELETYIDDKGSERKIPQEFRGVNIMLDESKNSKSIQKFQTKLK